MSFISVMLVILSSMITIYLVQSSKKTSSTWLLICFFFAVIANSLVTLAANGWVFWGHMLMPAQDACILLGAVPLALYAYRYPDYDQKRESRFVLALTGAVALLAVGYSLYYAYLYMFLTLPV